MPGARKEDSSARDRESKGVNVANGPNGGNGGNIKPRPPKKPKVSNQNSQKDDDSQLVFHDFDYVGYE